jgi:hypothetical protein
MKIHIYDKDRKIVTKQLCSISFDRDNNISLVVYLDKKNKSGYIDESDKIYCNNFEILSL